MRPIALAVAAAVAVAAAPNAVAAESWNGIDQSFSPYLGQNPPAERRWFADRFETWETNFVRADGRVVDPQNNGMTHSEGQAYGMMLALLGSDRTAFDRIWRFARSEMQRPDALISWKWVPGYGVTDVNNATDAELLLATALTLAGLRWEDDAYLADAERIAHAVGDNLIWDTGDYTVILPGEWARPQPPSQRATINLSYFIPVTLPVMESLAPRYPWEDILRDTGRLLSALEHAPSDWTNITRGGDPRPAIGFPPLFSYDAVRVPLYLMQYGMTNDHVTTELRRVWGPPETGEPFPFRVRTQEREGKFWGEAYQFMYELLHCVESGDAISPGSFELDLSNYFASSLHLMSIAALYAHYPDCYPMPS